MKETLVTGPMFSAGLVKPGMRVRVRWNDEPTASDGHVTALDNEDVHVQYDSGETDALFIGGFCGDAEEEAKATQRLYLLEVAEPLYILMDCVLDVVLLKSVTMDEISAYTLAVYRGPGSNHGRVNHLGVVAMTDVKPVKVAVVV